MLHGTRCPNCQEVGWARAEHVICGKNASRRFYCGHCHHEWEVADPDSLATATMPPPPSKPRNLAIRGKRRTA